MNKNNNIILGLVVVIIVLLGFIIYGIKGSESTTTTTTIPTTTTTIPTTGPVIEEQESIDSNSIGRLRENEPIVNTLWFTGKGDVRRSRWGKAVIGTYVYNSVIKSTSIVESKKVCDSGAIEITEIRDYKQVKDVLQMSDIDVAIDFSSTPIYELLDQAKLLTPIIGLFSESGGVIVDGAIETLKRGVKTIDGFSFRNLLEKFGIKSLPENVEEIISGIATGHVKSQFAEIKTLVNKIEKKKFRITYRQTKEGEPLRVEYEHDDGSTPSNEEMEILRIANLFIDYEVLPSEDIEVGESWEIKAQNLSMLVDPVAGDRCIGNLKLTRNENHPNGDMNISIAPTKIEYMDKNRVNKEAIVKINAGSEILCDETGKYVKAVVMYGEGALLKTTKTRHVLLWNFKERLSGNCSFISRLITVPKSEELQE